MIRTKSSLKCKGLQTGFGCSLFFFAVDSGVRLPAIPFLSASVAFPPVETAFYCLFKPFTAGCAVTFAGGVFDSLIGCEGGVVYSILVPNNRPPPSSRDFLDFLTALYFEVCRLDSTTSYFLPAALLGPVVPVEGSSSAASYVIPYFLIVLVFLATRKVLADPFGVLSFISKLL